MLPVPESYLGRLTFLNEGKFGWVYRTGYTIHSSDPTELVYKKYKISVPGGDPARSAARAERAVEFRDGLLDRSARAILDTYFAWPREVVEDDATGKTIGFLMPLAPPKFFWNQGLHVKLPRTLDWLTTTENFWQTNKVDLSELTATDRLFLMGQLVYAIAWLHKQGWVFGDLSFTNVAFAMHPDPPRLLIFDCDDAVELADALHGGQPHTPFWFPPECLTTPPAPQDTVTDVYKLGLAIVRCLKPGDGTVTTTDVGRLADILDPEGLRLLARTLSDDRDERPTARELFAYLDQVATPRMVAPVIAHAELLTPLLPPGGIARVHWQIAGAEEINVFFGAKPQETVATVTLADPPGECGFPVTRSGQVTLEAKNRYGTSRRVIGEVSMFEIPQFTLDPVALPRPDIPPIPEHTTAPLPDLPVGHPGAPSIPSIPEPGFTEVLREFAPGSQITSPGDYINSVLDTSRSLIDMIQADNKRFISRLRRRKMGNGNGQALSFLPPRRRGPQAAG